MDIQKKGGDTQKKKVGGVTVTMATPVDPCISILGVHARRVLGFIARRAIRLLRSRPLFFKVMDEK